MAKYDRLGRFLVAAGAGKQTLTFGRIDQLVGGLPASARQHRAWWGNEVDGRHVQAGAWIGAGWNAEVDLAAGIVTFSRR